MAKIQAVQQDYKRAFQKYLHTYSNWDNKGSDISKRLVLVYCVECGLKYKLMESLKIHKIQDAQEEIAEVLSSHDLQNLLKRLKITGEYVFPHIQTAHNDIVTLKTYHQICRYAIRPIKAHEQLIQKYDEQLDSIVSWLKEQV